MPTPLFPIDYNAVRVALVRAVELVTQLDQNHVVTSEPEEADAPRPSNPYATIKILSPGIRYGWDWLEDLGNGSYNLSGPRGILVSFNLYGRSHEEAYNYAALLSSAFRSEDVAGYLAQAGLSVWNIGAVTDISELLNTGYEGRANITCTFGTTSVYAQSPGYVQTVVVDGSVFLDNGLVLKITLDGVPGVAGLPVGDGYQILDFTQNSQIGLSFSVVDTAGAPVNIAGYSVALEIAGPAGGFLEKIGFITNAAQGLALFSFVPGDFTFTGLCDSQLKITDAGGNTRRLRGFAFRVYPQI